MKRTITLPIIVAALLSANAFSWGETAQKPLTLQGQYCQATKKNQEPKNKGNSKMEPEKTAKEAAVQKNWLAHILATSANLNPKTVTVTDAVKSPNGKAVTLMGKSTVKDKQAKPDVVFPVKIPFSGLYVMRTESSLDEEGALLMEKIHSKFDSLYARIQVGDSRATERVIFEPWRNPLLGILTLGKFEIAKGDQEIKLWLPEHLKLHKFILIPYTPVRVPADAQAYTPEYLPPPVHPRLWVTPALLPGIRQNLTAEENLPHWEKLKLRAQAPLEFQFDPNEEIPYNESLETGIHSKAFYYLMTGDKSIGQEALKLATDYISHVEFGNILDITREIGRAIYVTSCTYDWCYDIMTQEQRDTILQNFRRLRRDMECGWPPFGQDILNGHGNERQVNRDLLSMSIAIYDEDPEPYKYCAYKVLKELVPMRKWEYQSPRHNQGISYSSFRFQCDMHAATIFLRMLGHEVFDPNIKNVPLYWFYMRAPNGSMLRDGDGVCDQDYWGMPLTNLFNYSYGDNPLCKGEFIRQKGLIMKDSIYFLLLNKPELKPEMSLDSLPWTQDFGPILGSMVARTGWNLGALSDDVVAEFKGGGYHSGNHLHADAGSFQLFYRGWLVARLDQYGFYGTPYDMNFNKRSISKSMILVRDPKEKFLSTDGNDGGSRFIQRHPTSPKMTQTDPEFYYGKKLSGSFGPSEMRPYFSYFAADLTGAYSEKVKSLTRRFCFFNLGDKQLPALIVIADDVEASDPEFRKYWQICSLKEPDLLPNGLVLHSEKNGRKGKMFLDMLQPKQVDIELCKGDAMHDIFGFKVKPPYPNRPEPMGSRVMFKPKKASARDRFLTVMQVADDGAQKLPVAFAKSSEAYQLSFKDTTLLIAASTAPIEKACEIKLSGNSDECRLLAAGLAAGKWSIQGKGVNYSTVVKEGKNTLFFVGKPGKYLLSPGKAPNSKPLPDYSEMKVADIGEVPYRGVYLDNRKLEGAICKVENDVTYIPMQTLLKATGLKYAADAKSLNICDGKVIITADPSNITLNGMQFKMSDGPKVTDGEWYVPAAYAALILRRGFTVDGLSESILFEKDELFTTKDGFDDRIVWAESPTNPDFRKLYNMVLNIPSKEGYWDGFGNNASFVITLREETVIDHVKIHFLRGNTRVAKFSIEAIDAQGKVTRVFTGESDGKTDALETFSFKPTPARQIRFVGNGNTINKWNSVVTFVIGNR